MDPIDARLARINARLVAEREGCPACEARAERAAILEYDAGLSRSEADRQACVAHPCKHARVA